MQAKIQKLDNQFKEDIPRSLKDRYVCFRVLDFLCGCQSLFFSSLKLD